jgi:hypothetical protein
MQRDERLAFLVSSVVCVRSWLGRIAGLENRFMDRVPGCHGGTMSAQRFPMRGASTAASLARFSCLVLLLPLDTVLDFCRLDRSDGNGFAQ